MAGAFENRAGVGVERPQAPDPGAERRQLTVLFCDLVDSTALASAMDPEELHDLMLAYQRHCARCIEDAGGFVARFAGDGVLAYFGYPIAREDAPQRAIHAALSLRATGEHFPKPNGRPLAVRTGVATGLVVVGSLLGAGAAQERAVTGETPNLAARLQARAAPDTIVVSDTTRWLAEGVFEFRSLGSVTHKGLASPAPAWEVLGRRATVSRFEGRRAVGIGPLIGREAELAMILEAWRATRSGQSRVVGIVGEPGIGKSRLLDEAHRRIRDHGDTLWLEGGGVSIYDNTPFHVLSQVAGQLAAAQPSGDGAGPAPSTGELPPSSSWLLDEMRSPDELLSQLKRQIEGAAEQRPTVLVVEDLHWADPSTLDFMDLLVPGDEDHALLVIYTTRQDFSERWPSGARHRVITLPSLNATASAGLARSASGRRLTAAQVNAVVLRAAGVPLYIEELARLVADQGETVAERALPPTLSDLLAARLEDLGPAKRHAQVASVLGHEFSGDLFAAMTALDGADPAQALAALQSKSIIVQRQPVGHGGYAFRHALIADAAYDILLKRQRRALHARAVKVILELHPALAEAQPQVLAHHWTEAGDTENAVAAWQAAGDIANTRRAFREAEHAYRQALSMLESDARSADRDQKELTIRAAFNRVLQVTQGYSALEAARSSERVTELAASVGKADVVAREEQVRWRSVFTGGDYAQAEAIVARVMSLTEAHGDPLWRRTFRLRAGIQQGFYTGDLARGESDFLVWSAIQDGSHRGVGDDVLSMGIAGLIAEMTGRQAVARKRIVAAFAIARQRGNPYDLAMAVHNEACFHHFAQDPVRQARSAARLAGVAGESGFDYASLLATGWLAIADLNSNRPSEALERCTAAIAGFDHLGARVALVFWLGVLARAQWLNGDTAAARDTFDRALRFNDQEQAFKPETHLARAGVWRALGETREAERDLAEAATISASMGATLFHFRALVQLAALHLATGEDVKFRRAMESAEALARPDLCRADRVRFEALRKTAGRVAV